MLAGWVKRFRCRREAAVKVIKQIDLVEQQYKVLLSDYSQLRGEYAQLRARKAEIRKQFLNLMEATGEAKNEDSE